MLIQDTKQILQTLHEVPFCLYDSHVTLVIHKPPADTLKHTYAPNKRAFNLKVSSSFFRYVFSEDRVFCVMYEQCHYGFKAQLRLHFVLLCTSAVERRNLETRTQMLKVQARGIFTVLDWVNGR